MGRLIGRQGRVVPAALLSARAQAEEIVAQARAESAALRADAERRGFEAGKAAGREAGVAEATQLLLAARAHSEGARARARDAALVLARRMAEKIVRRAVALDPETMGEIVAQAVEASRALDGAVVVRVHPEDLIAVEAQRPRWSQRLSAAASLRVVPDPSVGRAGCVVDTPVGRLDARLAVQLDAFEKAMSPRR
jgi:type III secretion protein L